MPATLPAKPTTKTTSTFSSNAEDPSPGPVVSNPNVVDLKLGGDQRIENLSAKDTHDNSIVYDKTDDDSDDSDARTDVAVICSGNRIYGPAVMQMHPLRDGGHGLGDPHQWMSSGTALNLTNASSTNPNQLAQTNVKCTASNIFGPSPNLLNASNLTILNQQNKQSTLNPSNFPGQTTNAAQSTSSVRAMCLYDERDYEGAPADWTAATAATAMVTAAAGAARNNKERRCEHDRGKSHITWNIRDTVKDDVPDWEFFDEGDATEAWNAIDIIDRVASGCEVEGWSLV